jgi:hypothetical protein
VVRILDDGDGDDGYDEYDDHVMNDVICRNVMLLCFWVSLKGRYRMISSKISPGKESQ